MTSPQDGKRERLAKMADREAEHCDRVVQYWESTGPPFTSSAGFQGQAADWRTIASILRTQQGDAPGWRTMESAPRDGSEIVAIGHAGPSFWFAHWSPTFQEWYDSRGNECYPEGWIPLPPWTAAPLVEGDAPAGEPLDLEMIRREWTGRGNDGAILALIAEVQRLRSQQGGGG